MSMMKNLLSSLAILLVIQHNLAVVNLFNNLDRDRVKAQVEAEVLLCFERLAVSTYTVDTKVIDTHPVTFFGEPAEMLFPMTINALMYISEQLFKDENIAPDLWEKASASYQLFYADDNVGAPVPFHNICHGMHVMLYAMLLGDSATLDPNTIMFNEIMGRDLAREAKAIAALGFAGLFHDAGHNGFGNYIHQGKENFSDAVHDKIIASIKANWPLENMTAEDNDYEAIDKLAKDLTALKGNNKNGDFLWENIHSTIAEGFFNYYAGMAEDEMRVLIVNEIDHTDMSMDQKPFFNKIEEQIFQIEKVDKSKDSSYDKLLNNLHTNYHHIDHFVHAVDISLNGSNNSHLVFIQIPLVLQEFVNELTETRTDGTYDGTYNESGPFKALCGKAFNELISGGQTGFNNYVIAPYLKNEAFLSHTTLESVQRSFLKYYTDAEVISSAFQEQESEGYLEAIGLTNQTKAKLDIINEVLKDSELLNYDSITYLKYLTNNININNTLFAEAINTSADQFRFSEDEMSHACRTDRRLRRLIV